LSNAPVPEQFVRKQKTKEIKINTLFLNIYKFIY